MPRVPDSGALHAPGAQSLHHEGPSSRKLRGGRLGPSSTGRPSATRIAHEVECVEHLLPRGRVDARSTSVSANPTCDPLIAPSPRSACRRPPARGLLVGLRHQPRPDDAPHVRVGRPPAFSAPRGVDSECVFRQRRGHRFDARDRRKGPGGARASSPAAPRPPTLFAAAWALTQRGASWRSTATEPACSGWASDGRS